jgi:hypothetical protein
MTPEIHELEHVLRADLARPDAAFAEELGRRVRKGFPRKRPRLPHRRVLAVATAAASVVLGVGIVLSAGGEEKSDVRALSGSAPAGGRDSQLAAQGDRAIERSASLTIAAPGDELDDVADRVIAVTDRYRGFVGRSSVTTGDDEASGGTFELRIPADSLRPAIRDLSALGHVRSRTESGEDVTRHLTEIRGQLRTFRAERSSLLRRLERADTDSQAEALRQRLLIVGRNVDLGVARLRDQRERVAYADVNVSLERENSDGGGGGTTGDAFKDALGSLTGAVNIAIRALGVALPLVLLAALALLAGQKLLRRRREAALS